jgi:methionyl-tRNA formyltransferase
MRVIFLGTPEFAIPSLRRLLASSYYEVCAVVTQPDRPAGRGRQPQAPPVKILAQSARLPVHQPEKIRDPLHKPVLESYTPDFIVVVAFGQILPRWLLELPRLAPVNVHASLLPRYRGAAPVNWALLKGEACSGATTMLMEERLDTGPILMQREFPLTETITAGQLAEQLAAAGAELLIPTLDGLRDGTLRPIAQDESQASYAPRITKEIAVIPWEKNARIIHNQVRGLNPWPLAYSFFRGQKLQVFRTWYHSNSEQVDALPGTYLGSTQGGILVQCGEASVLELLEVQLAGKSRVSGRAFANGARLKAGELLFTHPDGA